MGYNTEFTGTLLFNEELRASDLGFLNSILGEDCRDHHEWNNIYDNRIPHERRKVYFVWELTYIDLKINKEFTGVVWNGSEKTYDLVDKINLVIALMRHYGPAGFTFTGNLYAHEEDGSKWKISIGADGFAFREEILDYEKNHIACPNCNHEFNL